MAYSTTALTLGTPAPNFALLDTVSGKIISLQDVASSKATVIMFISNHCPYVLHVLEKLVALAEIYQAQGINFVAIGSNDAESYPQDGPEQMAQLAKQHRFPFPYLYDQTQQVARTYLAACTPEFFVMDNAMQLVYHGQFDSTRPNSGSAATGEDLQHVLDCLLQNKPVPQEQTSAMGCSIKWKALAPQAE